MPPIPTSVFYAARYKAGVAIAYVMKSAEFCPYWIRTPKWLSFRDI